MKITGAKGQATIEAIFVIPFMIVFFIFIYQSYVTLNKAQIAQKALRGSVIRSTLNRYDVTYNGNSNNFLGTNTDPKGSFVFSYSDDTTKGVSYSLDELTSGLILVFANKEQYNGLRDVFSNLYSEMKMGVCLGGGSISESDINPQILNMDKTPWTCTK